MELTTIPDVELCQIGTWDASTGRHTFTVADWTDAVAATADPAFRVPQVYLGHSHAKFGDATPSVGRIVNLRVSDDGVSLRGDLELLPVIAELAAVAWPSRSIEGQFAVTSSTGNRYRMILTGLALLGAQLPALETLDDLPALAGIAAATTTDPTDTATPFSFTPGDITMTAPTTAPIAASVNTENIRRAWWDHRDDNLDNDWNYSWCRGIYAGDEQFIIVETNLEVGGSYLHRIDWTETDGNITFGDPTPVREAFLPAETGQEDAAELSAPGTVQLARYTPRDTPVRASATPAPCTTTDTETPEETATVTTPSTPNIEQAAEPAVTTSPVVTIDPAILADLQAGAAAGAQAIAELRAQRHTNILDRAISAGRIAPVSRDKFAALLAKDEAATVELIDSLATGAPTIELGSAVSATEATDEALYALLTAGA